MNNTVASYQVVDFPPERRAMPAFLDLKTGKHSMYALLEVDVTVPRKFIEDHRALTGEQLSFTGYLVSCLARAVYEHREVQAYRKGSKQLVIYDDVDVGIMVELMEGEKKVLTGHVIRAANRKTFRQIHQEIRSVQTNPEQVSAAAYSWLRSALLLPWPLSSLFKALFRFFLIRNPALVVSMTGTVGISSLGMFSKGHSGWGISSGYHGLDLWVGGISPRLAEVDGKIETRHVLNLTVMFDHLVIDGAPAARFTGFLVELIESGSGLEPSVQEGDSLA